MNLFEGIFAGIDSSVQRTNALGNEIAEFWRDENGRAFCEETLDSYRAAFQRMRSLTENAAECRRRIAERKAEFADVKNAFLAKREEIRRGQETFANFLSRHSQNRALNQDEQK